MNANRKWSEQQEAIFDWFKSGKGNLVVVARAGVGKTTTAIEAVGRAPESRILLAAFNKKIAEELKTRLTKGEAKTLHSVGFSIVMRNWRGVRLDDKRGNVLAQRAADSMATDNSKAPVEVISLVQKLASKGKGMAPFANVSELAELAFQFSLVPSEGAEENGWTVQVIAAAARKAMTAALNFDGTLDFDDMVYVPVANRWVRGTYEMVVIDEAQDMNAAQLMLATKVCLPNGRIAVIGDDRQAIYAFRGADSGSLARMEQELKATKLGLTTTYRCPKAVVAIASKLVPDFQAADTAPEGSVEEIDYEKLAETAKPGSFVLSRKNAPLARTCLKLLRNGTRARIEGRDIGYTLVRIVRGIKARSIPEFLVKLDKWAVKQAARANGKNAEAKVEQIEDQRATLSYLAEGMAGMAELTTRIEELFADTNGSNQFVVCSSVHRAKGLEADTVYILRDTLYPGGRQNEEEQNIEYVAVTRAKNKLVWVDGLGVDKE